MIQIKTIRGLVSTIFIIATLTLLSVGYYGLNLYQNADTKLRYLSEQYGNQLSAAYSLQHKFLLYNHEWKTILLRGQDSEQYYLHLKRFYEYERNIRQDCKRLEKEINYYDELLPLLTQFKVAFRKLGKDYRQAIKIFNETIRNPHIIADNLTKNEGVPEELINNFVIAMGHWQKKQLEKINTNFKNQEKSIFMLLLVIVVSTFMITLFIIQRRIVRPIREATFIAKSITQGNLQNSLPKINYHNELSQLLHALIVMQTEIRESQSALMDERENAEKANNAKSEFLSSMSHELRTPMNAILGFTQVLEVDKKLTPSQLQSVEEILQAGRHLLELINEVLDLAKIEEGKLEVFLKNTSVTPVVISAISLLQPQSEQYNVTIYNNLPDDTDYIIKTDPLRIRQVIINLLSNAIKYNNKGGKVTIDCSEENENTLRISITDTGPGISAEKFDKLFIPFERLGFEGAVVEGAGIGLSISKRFIELMQGHIGVSSKEGEGSTFFIDVPLIKINKIHSLQGQDEDNNTDIQQETDLNHRDSFSILYVEDNPASLKLMERLLADYSGISLITAHTGTLGLDIAQSQLPDLILLDINLPGMNGLDVLHQLKINLETRHIPVVVLSANAMERDINAGKAAGCDDYLVKPLNLKEFKVTMQKYISTKPQHITQ